MQVKMFGALRKFSNEDGIFQFKISEPMTVSKFKTALSFQVSEEFKDFNSDLLMQSAIANQEEILSDDYLIQQNEFIAVLPPVCGG